MARYIFIDRKTAIEKGLITSESACRQNATTVVLIEDELKKLGDDVDKVIEELGAVAMDTKQALKELQKREWNV